MIWINCRRVLLERSASSIHEARAPRPHWPRARRRIVRSQSRDGLPARRCVERQLEGAERLDPTTAGP